MIADWCAGSGTPPTQRADRRLEGEAVATGVCFSCRRRVRLTTQGHLRRHRPFVNVQVAAQRHPSSTGELPPRRKR